MMKRYSRRKQVLYSAILLVCVLVVVETGSHLIYAIVWHQAFPFGKYEDAIDSIAIPPESLEDAERLAAGEIERGNGVIEVIHPYLGYVRDPRSPGISYLGFPRKDDPLRESNSGSITVAVFGGSFAAGTSTVGRSVIESTLRDHGIDARVLTIAMGGYKQPQQLFALSYLLSHGAQFDVVVNIDGFNEVALPPADNFRKGVNPFYPRAWYNRVLPLNDQVTLRLIGRVSALRDDRQRWAAIFRDMPKFSIMRNLVWQAYDNLLERRIADINGKISRSRPLAASRFLTTGPDLRIDGEAELYEQIANHWKTCSLLMKALCDSQGITYIHILQPNQYFAAGRTLTETEKKNAFREDHSYRPGVVEGYPRLLAAKNDLMDRGVNFHDLTTIYRDIPEPIYRDACCHPYKRGYEIIARYVANTIIETMTSQADDPRSTLGTKHQ